MRTLRAIALVLVVAGAPAATRARETPAAKAPTDPVTIARAGNEFTLKLYAKLAGAKGNVFFSPSSIHTALAMTYAGAKGRTAEQMAETLALPRGDQAAWTQHRLHKAYRGLLAQLRPGKAKGCQLHVANALWGQKGYPWLKTFLSLTADNYGAGLREVDFKTAAEQARLTINKWVEDQTNEKIRELIGPGILKPLTRLVLTNAIYFKGDWASRFEPKATRDAPFKLSAGKTVKVPMMYQKGEFGYFADRKALVLGMPYKGGELSMLVLLPAKFGKLAEFEKSLTAARIAGWSKSLRKQEVRVYLPKFRLTSSFRLDKALTDLGMRDAFTYKADFSGMNGRKDLFISAVLHKAFVDVNEEGTEAAGATAVVMEKKNGGRRLVFRADRPFLFLIRHNATGAILFMGRVADPRGDAATGKNAGTNKPAADSGSDRARKFWDTLASGDTVALKDFYASKVIVKAGSELLKPRWGLPGTDGRDKDTLVAGDDLVAGYERLIAGMGRDKWKGIFAKFTKDRVGVSVAARANMLVKGVRKGDVVVDVAIDEKWAYVLRKSADGVWRVVIERTDY